LTFARINETLADMIERNSVIVGVDFSELHGVTADFAGQIGAQVVLCYPVCDLAG
jgi:hypothetical protein